MNTIFSVEPDISFGNIAQLVERRFEAPCAAGANPAVLVGTKYRDLITSKADYGLLFCFWRKEC